MTKLGSTFFPKLLPGESVNILTSSNSVSLLASSRPANRKTSHHQSQNAFVLFKLVSAFYFISHLEDHPFQQELSSCVVTVLESCSGDLRPLLD